MRPFRHQESFGEVPPDDWLAVSESELDELTRRLAERDARPVPPPALGGPAKPTEGGLELPVHPLPQGKISKLENVAQLAASLEPYDRMRLIARLWESLPQESWPPLSDSELTAARRRLIESDTRWNEPVPWQIVERLLADRFAPRIYSVPRRFDLATLFIVTLAYSLLFTLMTSLQFPPGVSLAAAGFITIVGAAQAVLFGGRRPRTASIWTGAVLYGVPMLGGLIGARPLAFGGVPVLYLGMQLLIGGVLGYFAGACVGGVFLLADVVRRRFRRSNELDGIESAGPFARSEPDRYANVIESPPPNSLWQFLFDPRDASKLFSAPRRFDLAAIFVITAAYSLLFGFLSLFDRLLNLQLQPGMTIVAGGLITSVAIGQAWLFGQANPRGVSVIVGGITFTFFSVILSWIYPRMFPAPWLFVVLLSGVIGGSFFGYIAGVLVGGMFLFADVLRQRFSVSPTDEDPFADVDQPRVDREPKTEPAVSRADYH